MKIKLSELLNDIHHRFPLEPLDVFEAGCRGIGPDGNGGPIVAFVQPMGDDGSGASDAPERDKNAAYLCHAANVLPEVLAALERAELSTTQIRLAANIGRKSIKDKVCWYERQLEQLGKEVSEAIAKASEVEVA